MHLGKAGPWPETQNVYHTNVHVYYYQYGRPYGKVDKLNLHVTAGYFNGQWCAWFYNNPNDPPGSPDIRLKNCHSVNYDSLQEYVRQKVIEFVRQVMNFSVESTWLYNNLAIYIVIAWWASLSTYWIDLRRPGTVSQGIELSDSKVQHYPLEPAVP